VVNDISQEPDFSDKYDRLTGFKTRSLICVPLVLRGKSIGAIQVLNKKTQEPFSDADLKILTSLCNQIAIAMDNANLYHRLEEKFELTTQELKTTQEKLIRSERLAAMGHLVDGVAHEIRNPITVIGGFARRIKEQSEDKETLEKYADIILAESERLERLVKKVRELAEVQTASLQPDNIGHVVDKILKIFLPSAENRGIKIMVNMERDIPLVDMDGPQMVMALSNIIENSLEAIDENGEISLNIKKIDNELLIEIKDTGAGIKEDDITSIYDPFVTSKTRGAGLGLTMTYQIILNHKGEIRITSMKGEGTTVAIKLPILH
jgi:signal transduction histidine kinase